ncbi:MAG TPA: site-specific DNA-methyltransferase [bacterium]|nr:site-specific DNA-methyltransferase [bacterium]
MNIEKYRYYKNPNGTLYCSENKNVVPYIKEKIDLMYADPPYNFNAGGGKGFYRRPGKRTIIQKLKDSFGHKFNPKEFFDLTDSIPKFKPWNIYVWTNKKLMPVYLNWALKNKMNFNILTWHKMNCPPLWKNNYLPDTEYLLFFRKKGAYFDSTLNIDKYRKYWITTVNTLNKFNHPCPKPLDITLAPIEISCPPGGLVCDPYSGTGTTIVACERLGRRWISIERTKEYCETQAKRIDQEYHQFKTNHRR